MIPKEQRCEKQMRSEWATGGQRFCTRARKLEHEGKWYCTQHHPPTVDARRGTRAEVLKAAMAIAVAEIEAVHRRRAAEERACQGISTEDLETGIVVLARKVAGAYIGPI